MAILLAIIVVNVRGLNVAVQNFESRGDSFFHVGVPDVEAEVELQMRPLEKIDQAFGARKLVGNILQKHIHSTLAGKQVNLLQGREGRIQFALVKLFLGYADMLDQVAEWDGIGDVQGALDLVQHGKAF